MDVTDKMVTAGQAVAPEVPGHVVRAILQAGVLAGAVNADEQLSALCRGVARILAGSGSAGSGEYLDLMSAVRSSRARQHNDPVPSVGPGFSGADNGHHRKQE